MSCNRNIPRDEANDNVLLGFELRYLPAPQHLHTCVDQKCAKKVNNPVETIDQLGADQDHHNPHHQSAQYSPVKHAMLIFQRNLEIRENEQEDKGVIDGKRKLNQVSRKKLEGLLMTCGAEQSPSQGPKK